MYELVLTACLIATGACEPVRIPFAPETPMHACLIGGMQTAAQWQTEHPGYEVRSIRCRPAGRDT